MQEMRFIRGLRYIPFQLTAEGGPCWDPPGFAQAVLILE